MYQLTSDPNVVIDVDTGAFIPNSGNWQWAVYETWLAAGNTPQPAIVLSAAQQLANAQASLCEQIDAMADEVYIAIGGPTPGRLAEYQQASTDANAFKAAGYSGTVPVTVSCWAQANTGWTNQQAADDIIATAAKWISALQNIRSARLLGKSAVNAAATIAAAQTASATAIQNVQTAGKAA